MGNLITLTAKTKSVLHLCRADERISAVIKRVGDIAYTPADDSFVSLVDTIIGQMLSNKVADIMSARLRALCSNNVTPASLAELKIDDYRNIGIARTKASYIIGLAGLVIDKKIDFSVLRELQDKEVIEELTKIKGIGVWSAKMYLIFVLDRQDGLPFEDGAFLQSFAWAYRADCSVKEIVEICAKWRPYSSIAARYLYKALDMGLTKGEIGNR